MNNQHNTMTDEQNEILALHRKLAGETLRADQGWQRYESANARAIAAEAKIALLSAQLSEVLEEVATACEKVGALVLPEEIRALKTAAPQPSTEAAQPDYESESYRQGWMDGMSEAAELCAKDEASSDKAVLTDERITKLATDFGLFDYSYQNDPSAYVLRFARDLLQSAAPAMPKRDEIEPAPKNVEMTVYQYVGGPNDGKTFVDIKTPAPAQTVAKEVEREQVCKECNGRGETDGTDGGECFSCKGTGCAKQAIASLSVSAQEGEK